GGNSTLRAPSGWTDPAITLGTDGLLVFNSTTAQDVVTSVHNDGAVRVYSPSLTYSGIISGTGALEIGSFSASHATFYLPQTFTGTTTIAGNSSLTLAQTATLAGAIVNNGTLTFDRADNFTLGATTAISGSGALVKAGT